MSDRVSETILLCEDEAQERLVKAYLKRCSLPTQEPYLRSVVASQMQHGGNITWVLREFPKQLQACRRRAARARTLLIVVIDADEHAVQVRRQHLIDQLKQSDAEELADNDPAVLLIPRRHIETWIRALLGEAVNEDVDCKGWDKVTKDEIRRAAHTAYEWARDNATPGSTCVPSLRVALTEWRKIG